MEGAYQKVWEVDPLICPQCGSEMRIINLIQDPDVIRQILKHLGLLKQDARSRCKNPKPDHGPVVYEEFDDETFIFPSFSRHIEFLDLQLPIVL